MIQLNVSAVKNSPGEALNLDMNARIGPLQGGHGEVTFNYPLGLKGVLKNEGGALRLTGVLEGIGRVACGRCLEPFDLTVRADLEEVYYDESQPGTPGDEWVPFRGDRLDLAPEMEKAILSSLPMKFLCRGDCRGICPRCGINLNSGDCGCPAGEIDQRLEVLKQLLKKDG